MGRNTRKKGKRNVVINLKQIKPEVQNSLKIMQIAHSQPSPAPAPNYIKNYFSSMYVNQRNIFWQFWGIISPKIMKIGKNSLGVRGIIYFFA